MSMGARDPSLGVRLSVLRRLSRPGTPADMAVRVGRERLRGDTERERYWAVHVLASQGYEARSVIPELTPLLLDDS